MYNKQELLDYIMDKSEYCWDKNIKAKHITKWLSNFTGKVFEVEKEHYLALNLLQNFTFYTHSETKHLCSELFMKYISKKTPINSGNYQEYIENLINNTYFVPLGNPSESGNYFSYFFRKVNRISYKNLIMFFKTFIKMKKNV